MQLSERWRLVVAPSVMHMVQQLQQRCHCYSSDIHRPILWGVANQWTAAQAVCKLPRRLPKCKPNLGCQACRVQPNCQCATPTDRTATATNKGDSAALNTTTTTSSRSSSSQMMHTHLYTHTEHARHACRSRRYKPACNARRTRTTLHCFASLMSADTRTHTMFLPASGWSHPSPSHNSKQASSAQFNCSGPSPAGCYVLLYNTFVTATIQATPHALLRGAPWWAAQSGAAAAAAAAVRTAATAAAVAVAAAAAAAAAKQSCLLHHVSCLAGPDLIHEAARAGSTLGGPLRALLLRRRRQRPACARKCGTSS